MSKGTRELKLVGADTYVGPRSENTLIVKGQTYHFTDEHARALLAEKVVDRLNNEHPLFVDVKKSAATDDDEEAEVIEPARAKKKVVRTRRAEA